MSSKKERQPITSTPQDAFDGVFNRTLAEYRNCTIKETFDGITEERLNLSPYIGSCAFQFARSSNQEGTVASIIERTDAGISGFCKLGDAVLQLPGGAPATKEQIFAFSQRISSGSTLAD